MVTNKQESSNKLKMKVKDWFPPEWLKCTIPILEDPGLTTDHVEGSAFVLKYGMVVYAVTARHVIDELKDPMIGFPTTDKSLERISSKTFQKYLNLEWINHDSLDLAVIPFKISPTMDVIPIPEKFWDVDVQTKETAPVTHIGYPDKTGASYADGSTGFFPVSTSGMILQGDQNSILTKTEAHHGASGGPLFLKNEGSPYPQLIGVTGTAKKLDGKYVGKSTSIPIRHVKSILDSEKMKSQVQEAEKFLKLWAELKKS